MNDVIREFLLETHENLAQLDADLITLEREPTERETLGRVFRTLHSVKGTAGFVGLPKLQAVAHAAESLLSRLRAKELVFNRPIASALLAVVDAIRQVLASIESDGSEGTGDYSTLVGELERLREAGGTAPAAAPTGVPTAVLARPVQPVVSGSPPLAAPVPPAAPSFVPPPPAPAPHPARSLITSTVGPPADAASEPRAAVADTALRVDVGLLDKLMTLVGELVLARNQIMQFSTSQEDQAFLGTVQRLNQLTTELQTNVMKTRMQPIGNVWSKFPRVVRDLAVACASVRFEMDGQETELDKTIIEAIRDLLTHIVRNAVDHGIEPPETRVSRGRQPRAGCSYTHSTKAAKS
ncbi:MAG: Hpt domain-containing protein [Gemmataceae bacterium]